MRVHVHERFDGVYPNGSEVWQKFGDMMVLEVVAKTPEIARCLADEVNSVESPIRRIDVFQSCVARAVARGLAHYITMPIITSIGEFHSTYKVKEG